MHIGSKIRISIILLLDISISSGTDVNTADAWWQNTAPWSAVGYYRPYYVSESAAVESPERESAPPFFSLMSQRVTIPAPRATPMTFIPQPTTNNTFSIMFTAPGYHQRDKGSFTVAPGAEYCRAEIMQHEKGD